MMPRVSFVLPAAVLVGSLAATAGCHTPPRGDAAGPVAAYRLAPGVRVTAAVHLLQFRRGEPDRVRARARVVSRGGAMLLQAVDHWCALTVRVYGPGAATGRVVLPVSSPDTVVACSQVLRGVTLLPGDTADFDSYFQTSDILGTALPGGRYHFTVVLNLDKPKLSTPELAAGSLVLRR